MEKRERDPDVVGSKRENAESRVCKLYARISVFLLHSLSLCVYLPVSMVTQMKTMAQNAKYCMVLRLD